MATGKRYYWIKISKDFMDSDAVNYLMGLKNGADYIMLYVSLCMMAINTGGELAMKIGDQIIPYDLERIRRDAKWFSAATIAKGIELFKKMGLLYLGDQGQCILANYASMVGSETDYADKQRRQRRVQHGGRDGYRDGYKHGYNVSENVPIDTEKETEKETDTELRDTDQDPYSSCSSSCAHARERPDADTLEAYASGCLRSMTEHSLEQLNSYRGDLPDELIRHAIDEACASGTPTWSYARAILNRYVGSGYRTVGDAEAAKAAWTRQRQASAPGPRSGAAAGYQQRAHTESDFAGLYIDMDAPDAGSGP